LEPFHNVLTEFVQRPGKRVRPLLFLQAAELFLPDMPAYAIDDLVSVAAGLELLHAFVLIHDDLIDGSDLRRTLPSLHRAFEGQLKFGAQPGRTGFNLAIVFGDLLFALAQKCITDTRIPVRDALLSRTLDYVFDTGYGEIADILLGESCISQVSAQEVELMYLCKTTRYTVECPLVLAGITAGLNEEELRQLVEIAQPAGLAFQIQNDVKEFVRGVALGSSDDLVEGKKTLLLRAAYDRLPASDRERLRALLQQEERTSGEIHEIQSLVLQSCAVAEQQFVMETLFEQAALAARSPVLSIDIQVGLHELLLTLRRLMHTL
jgi:geranylgeranyl diphosphate synthase type I